MKRLAAVLVLLLVFGHTLSAAEDISGKWAGSLVITVEGDTSKDDTAYLVLKQAGTTVTGTAGPSASDQKIPISNGKIETIKKEGKDVTSVTFAWDLDPKQEAPPLQFALTLVDGHLKGKAEVEFEGHKMTFALDVTRSK